MEKRSRYIFLLCLCILLFSCGGKEARSADDEFNAFETKYVDIVLGETAVDLEASVVLVSHRTDMASPQYAGYSWADYIRDFNLMYPGIKVSVEALTDYSATTMAMLEQGDWGDIMMIPITDMSQLSKYFIPYGTEEEISRVLRFADQYSYAGRVYGIASAGNVQGIVYNKRVFTEAGIDRLPRTPDEFLADLRQIKERTRAIPLYTNYASGWPLLQWDYYISCTATGNSSFFNHVLLHAKNPFSDPGDGSGAYNVYRILYQAVAEGLIEEDFTATDWDGCKGMMNRGDIATMALGSWVFTQIQGAGPNPDDIGYMPFPMEVDGVQIAAARPDNNFGINVRSSATKKLAAMVFVKWMVEKSGFQYNEGEIPVLLSEDMIADVYRTFDGMEIMVDAPPFRGEENLLTALNADSGLLVNQDGERKIRQLVEHAAAGDVSFSQLMEIWNERWEWAQKKNGISVN